MTPAFEFGPVTEADFDELVVLRIRVTRASLERLGRLGSGSAVLRRLFSDAPLGATRFRVGALRDSDANRFYLRHGFVKVSEDEWDVAYGRPRLDEHLKLTERWQASDGDDVETGVAATRQP